MQLEMGMCIMFHSILQTGLGMASQILGVEWKAKSKATAKSRRHKGGALDGEHILKV